MSELPAKLFFRIGEVAGLVGVEPHVLRYWEREFRSIRPTKSAKGQRVYSRRDVESLLRVRDLLYRDGFTIAGAKKKLQRPATELQDTMLAANESTMPRLSVQRSDDVASVPVAIPDDPASSDREQVREKLVELRSEVERFLRELETDPS